MSERVRIEFQSGQKKVIFELHSYRSLYAVRTFLFNDWFGHSYMKCTNTDIMF